MRPTGPLFLRLEASAALDTERQDSLPLLHEQLLALADAGVAIDVGFPAKGLREGLNRIEGRLSRQQPGVPLAEAVGGLEDTPAGYKSLVIDWLEGIELGEVLENHHRLARATTESRSLLGVGYLYPMIVALLACIGLAGFCWFLLPVLESTYQSIWIEPGRGVRWLQSARQSLPIWACGAPVLLLTVLWRLRHAPFGGGAKSLRRLSAAAEAMADRAEVGLGPEAPHRGDKPPLAVRPLFAWASAGEPRSSEDLHGVSGFYAELAKRRSRRLHTLAPLLACIVIGGGAVLIYALSLFLPFIELMQALAQTPAS